MFNEQLIKILAEGTIDTLYMSITSTFFAYLLGLPLGILVFNSRENGIKPNKIVNNLLGAIINIGRSIPFIIMLLALFPVTSFITGKTIGATSAIVPLTISAIPFIARLIETTLSELNKSVVEASQTMGATNFQIVTKVLLPETFPSIIRGFSITLITLIGYSAMAGAVGAGGLGDIAIRYGLHRRELDIMYVTIFILIIIVQIIQALLSFLATKIDKN